MNTERNNISLDFRSFDENHDTDINVSINGDNIDDVKLKRIVNTWLSAINSELLIS
jgi:hypothetical protein